MLLATSHAYLNQQKLAGNLFTRPVLLVQIYTATAVSEKAPAFERMHGFISHAYPKQQKLSENLFTGPVLMVRIYTATAVSEKALAFERMHGFISHAWTIMTILQRSIPWILITNYTKFFTT